MGKSRTLARSEDIRCLSPRLWMRPTTGSSRPTARKPVRRWSSSSTIAGTRRISFQFGGNADEGLGRREVNDNPQEALLRLWIRRSGDDLSVCSQYGSHAARALRPSRALSRQGEYQLSRNDSISGPAES